MLHDDSSRKHRWKRDRAGESCCTADWRAAPKPQGAIPLASGTAVRIAAHRIGRPYRDQLCAPEGVYRSFISSMWDVRHRIVHVRGMAVAVLPELHSLGLRPDMAYIDADKKGHEIRVCDELFPAAVIAGDD